MPRASRAHRPLTQAPAVPPPRPPEAPVLVLGEALYRQLVAVLPQSAVYLYDRDLRFALADGEAMRVAGLSPDTVIGKRLDEVVTPHSLAVLEPAYRAALRGESQDFDHPGEDLARWYRVRIRPVRSEDGEVIAGLVVTDDITEQRAAAAELAASRARWQRLFDDSPVGMWLAEPGPTGRLLEVNDALCDLLEMTREQVLASPKADLVSPDDPEAFSTQAANVASGAGPATCERRLLLADGTTRWLSFSATLVQDQDGPRSLAHFVDISETRLAQEQVTEAVAFQEAVLRVVPDPVRVVDATLHTHVWTSRPDELDVHPDDVHLLEASVRAVALSGDGEVVKVRHRALDADGGVHWVDRRKTPFRRDVEGQVVEYVSVSRDVTEEVRAEQQVRDAAAFQQAVLTASPDIISVFDLVLGQTVWASRSLTDELGWSLEQIQDRQRSGYDGLVHPEDVEELERQNALVAALPDGEFSAQALRIAAPDGSWHAFARRCTPFRRDESGRVTQVLNSARDITAEVHASEELERVRAFQQAVIRTTPDLVLVVEVPSGRATWYSRPVSELLGWDLADLSAGLLSLVHEDDVEDYLSAEREARHREDGEVVHTRFRVRHRRGPWHWLSRRMTPFTRDQSGAVTQLLATLRDVTDVVEAEQRLEQAALHDALTGLPNRRLVSDRLRTALSQIDREGELAVLFVDLDGFKRVNDAHGHEAGDAVLRAVAERLESEVRTGETVGRMGGDEFVVLLLPRAGETAQEAARHVGERLRAACAKPVAHGGFVHEVTASIGIAYATRRDDADMVLRDADTAMYRAKTGGKDRLAVFDPEHHAHALASAALERAVRAALRRDAVEVLYQPLVRTGTGRVDGYEALLRVPDGAGGHLDTQAVVTVSEQTGLMTELGARVLARACRDATGWPSDTHVAVNLSAKEVARPELYARVRETLGEAGLAPSRLVLELTETVLLEASRSTVRDLERLRDEGVGIAIDDFGTGYASLRYLATLPVSCVKVDRSFTRGLTTDPVSRTLALATIGLARDLGLDCVVEGVETQEQLELVGTEPHVLAQGYLLGRPGTAPVG